MFVGCQIFLSSLVDIPFLTLPGADTLPIESSPLPAGSVDRTKGPRKGQVHREETLIS